MLRFIREAAIERPWFYKVIMTVVAVAFVVTMGWGFWGGASDSKQPAIAQIGSERVSMEEYGRLLRQTERLYRDLLSQDIKEETIKRFVIDSLVERHLWLRAARDLGATIPDEELVASITRNESFHKNGRFDSQTYREALQRSGMSPERFEHAQREDLLVEKAKNIVRDGVVLAPEEIVTARATVTDTTLAPDKRADAEDQAIKNALAQKRQRLLLAYLSGIRAATPIEIKQQLL